MAAETILVKVGVSVVSIPVGFVANQVQNYISDHFQFQPAVKAKLRCLDQDLKKIQAVLEEADKRRIENSRLGDWLQDIKDATYDAEDVLDMFEYKIIQEKVEGTADEENNIFKRCFTSIVTEWLPYPNLLTSVEHLDITALEEMSFPTELVEWIQHLTSLHSLCFCRCEQLKSLPSNLINCLSTLRILKIDNCPNIKSLPEEGLPASIQELHVSRCYDLAKRCMNEYWQKMIAHIPTFTVDEVVVTEDNRKSLKTWTMSGVCSYDAEEEDDEEEEERKHRTEE